MCSFMSLFCPSSFKTGQERICKGSNETVINMALPGIAAFFLVWSFAFVVPINASISHEIQDIDLFVYSEIKKECYHFVYGIHRNLSILEWPDSVVRQVLKENLEAYLIGYLNTPESRKVYLEYESIDWNICEMIYRS